MNFVIIEMADRKPVSARTFPKTVRGRMDALDHAASIASENSNVEAEYVKADLVMRGEFEDGGWSVHLLQTSR